VSLLKRTLTTALTEASSLLHPNPPPGLRILLYHAVGSELPYMSMGLSVTPAAFREQMRLLKEQDSLELSALGAGALDQKRRVAVTFDDGYRDNLTAAAPILVELGIPFTVFVVPAYVESGNSLYLTVGHLKELAQVPGCQIGSHGMNHRRLADLPSGEALAELSESRRWLEDTLGRAVEAVAYPYGSASPAVLQSARSAGFTIGACSRTGTNTASRDPLMLCRTGILEWDDLRRFQQKLRGAWDWHRFRRRDPAAS
jgi:peptidoglycan/xylan/chitin deacetylase (PgdA/CDA1 family)